MAQPTWVFQPKAETGEPSSMALSGGAGWNSGKPAALSGRERVLERLPYRRRLSTVGGGGGAQWW
jgi:hypothetical protein